MVVLVFKGAVAGGGNISPGTDVKGNVRDDNPFTGGGKDEPPSPPIKDTKQKTPVVVNPIKIYKHILLTIKN